MNIMDNLPTDWQGWLDLAVAILAGALHTVVTNPWALTAALTLLVGLTAAHIAPMGTPEDSPILTEDDRKALR